MLARTVRALTSMTRRSIPARLVAVFCAAAILLTGFGHSVNHLGVPVLSVAVQIDAGALDDSSSDTSQIAPFAIEHCLGCMAIAVADLAGAVVPQLVMADLVVLLVDEFRPHTPIVEVPPPIFAI